MPNRRFSGIAHFTSCADVMKFVNSGSTSYPSINNVTKDTAKNMIVELNKYQNQTTNIPPEVKGYVSNWRNN